MDDHQGLVLPVAPNDVEWSEYHLSVLDPSLPIERFERLVYAASGLADAMRYWIGDLLLFGRQKYGEDVWQVLSEHGISHDQAIRYRLISERIAGSRRRAWGDRALRADFRLRWTHLHYLARFETVSEQEDWFALMLKKRWAPSELRTAMKDAGALVRAKTSGLDSKSAESSAAVDAARGVAVVQATLSRLGDSLDVETAEAVGIPQAASALEDVVRVVKQAAKVLSLEDAVERVLAAGVQQTGLADPAYIVPSGPWEALTEAYRKARGD